jgi:asparagine synthase (glutamine-hydrolysing)
LTTPPVPWFENKTLLREALRGALPDAVRLRPKAPFTGEISHIVARSQPIDWMCSLAETPGLEPFVNRERLLQLVRAPAQMTRQEHNSVQAPLALGYWLRGQSGLERTA